MQKQINEIMIPDLANIIGEYLLPSKEDTMKAKWFVVQHLKKMKPPSWMKCDNIFEYYCYYGDGKTRFNEIGANMMGYVNNVDRLPHLQYVRAEHIENILKHI